MVAIKAHQANAFLSKPDRKLRAILLFGTDPGLVSERAQHLAALLAAREKPPGEIIRLDDSDLDGDPDRLGVELLTVPMFGGAKIVRATPGRRLNAAALRPLVGGDPLPGVLIVEGGNMRPDDALRALFEKSPTAVAIGCYPDEGGSLDGLVSEVLDAAGLSIANDARQELVVRLGADRALSRAEIDKLALYARDAGRIELEHVEAIVGDASELRIDTVVTAAATGDGAAALAECDRAVASGENPQTVVLAAERHFQRLHRLRSGLDSGQSMDEVLRKLRPPLPFKVKAAVERQCRAWTLGRLNLALERITETVRRSRTTGADEAVLAERLLLELARLARAGTPARRSS